MRGQSFLRRRICSRQAKSVRSSSDSEVPSVVNTDNTSLGGVVKPSVGFYNIVVVVVVTIITTSRREGLTSSLDDFLEGDHTTSAIHPHPLVRKVRVSKEKITLPILRRRL